MGKDGERSARVAATVKRKQEEGDKIGIKGRQKRRSPRTSEMSYPSVSGALPSGGNRFRTHPDDKVLSALARVPDTRGGNYREPVLRGIYARVK